MVSKKDPHGYTTAGGYTGLSRSSRRGRNKNAEKRLNELLGNNDDKPKVKKIRKKCYKCLFMLIVGIILTLIALISANR